MTYKVTNQDLFSELRVQVDIHQDNVLVTWTQDGQLCTLESWGEHGPSDFEEYGFQIVY